MNTNPQIKALANEAAIKIKALTDIHQAQIAAIYQEFREQAANLQESNGEELHSPTVASIPVQQTNKESHDFTL